MAPCACSATKKTKAGAEPDLHRRRANSEPRVGINKIGVTKERAHQPRPSTAPPSVTIKPKKPPAKKAENIPPQQLRPSTAPLGSPPRAAALLSPIKEVRSQGGTPRSGTAPWSLPEEEDAESDGEDIFAQWVAKRQSAQRAAGQIAGEETVIAGTVWNYDLDAMAAAEVER